MHTNTSTFRILVLCLAISCLGLLSWSKANAQKISYRTYQNARFDYSISYPVDILFPQGESANGDGQKFLSKDGQTEMLVYGSNNSLDQTLRQVYEQETNPSQEHASRVITYHVLRADWFVVSGVENGRVFYQKTMLKASVFKTFRIDYSETQKGKFDSITAAIARSFKG